VRFFEPGDQTFDQRVDGFSWDVPEYFNIAQACCIRHAESPLTATQTALICVDEQDVAESAVTDVDTVAGTRYTFEQLHHLSNRFANALAHLGCKAGDRFAIVLPQRVETAIAHVAAHKLGAVSLPLSVLFGAEALQHRLADSGAKVVIASADHAETLSKLSLQLADLQHVLLCDIDIDNSSPAAGAPAAVDFWQLIDDFEFEFTCVNTRADDPACLIYTSGTTGPPKGALLAHRSLIGYLPGFELSLNFFPQADDVFFTPADWAWTGGLFDGLLPTLFYGMPIVGYDYRKFQPEKILDLLSRQKVTCGFFPPTALKMLRSVNDIKKAYSLYLRSIMSGGEMVGEGLLQWADLELGVVINEMYGQTEHNFTIGNCAAIMPPKPGSMGKAYPGHKLEILNDDGSVAAVGDNGEIVVHRNDAAHFLGYWNQPEATQKKYSGDWFHTGDVGFRDSDGYLWFTGRKDDVITSSGYRIGPGEIEDSILKHPAVLQVAVVGVPDPAGIRGDIVKAFIVLRDNFQPSETLGEDIKSTVRHQLSAHEYPRQVEFIDSLPITTTGKVRRLELRARDKARREAGLDPSNN